METIFLKLIFLTLILYNNEISAATIDRNSYLGCYVNNRLNREFTVYPGFIDRTTLIPSACVKACSTIGYTYAAIESGQYCFCRLAASITSVLDVDANCMTYTCPGDASTFCGSDTNLLVYSAGGIVSSINVVPNPALTNSTPFSRFSFDVTFGGPAKYIYVTTSDGALSSYDANQTQPIKVTQCIIDTGVTTLEFSGSASTPNSINAKKTAAASSTIQDFIGPAIISCPAYVATTDYVFCDITVYGGSHMEVTVTYGDGGTSDVFNSQDTELLYYGTPVPFSVAPGLLVTVPNTANRFFIIANSEFQFDGILRGIELYATSAGTIKVHILAACSGTFCCKQNIQNICASPNTHNCAGTPFSSLNNYCVNQTLQLATRFSTFVNKSINWSIKKTYTLNVQAGYNVFNQSNFMPQLSVYSTWMLGVETTAGSASLVVDTSASTYEDYEVTSFLAGTTLNGTFVQLNTVKQYKFMIRALILRPNIISTFRVYQTPSNYTVTAVIRNTVIAGATKTLTTNVLIVQGITNLTITSPLMCEINVPCTLSSNVAAGSLINYLWNITDRVFNTSSTSTSYTFTTFGVRLLSLVATNLVSRRVFSQNLTISEKITGVTFCSGLCSQSASIVGATAAFTFALRTGRDYTCLIDYGDSTSQSINFISNLNNSIVLHNYTVEAIYTVVVRCSNLLSTFTFTNQHHVQYIINGLRLIQKGALKNTPFNVGFSLATGTNADITFSFDGTVDTGITYDKNTKLGSSSPRAGEASGQHIIQIYAKNYVSSQFLNDTFEISAMITNPTLAVLLNGKSNAIYEFPSVLSFVINMDMGSNVQVTLYIGEEEQRNTLPYVTTVPGDWIKPLYINRTYQFPGDYDVTVNVSNAISFQVLVQRITLMSRVDGLIPGLASVPVLYMSTQSAGIAYYEFTYFGSTCAGSHANVTFWSGDYKNYSSGPFFLGMDFSKNISKTPMFYSFSASGTYQTVFLVTNPLGSKTFSLQVKVIPGIDGIYINVLPPNVAPSTLITLEIYIVQGENVTLEWFVDGKSLGASSRKSITYKVPDTIQYQTSNMKKPYYITCKASDNYFTVFRNYTLETQSVVNFNVSTTPTLPSLIRNDGSNITRTVRFSLTVLDGTNPFYMVDFNDGSPIDYPMNATIGGQYTFSHTFPDSGFYDVNITVFNKVSSVSKFVRVGLLSDFLNFDCKMKWRYYDNDDAIDYDALFDSIFSIYKVREDFDLRLFCTWISKSTPIDSFKVIWNTNVVTYTNLTILKNIENTTHAGYVVSLPSSILKTGRINDGVTVLASNALFTATYVGYVLKVASLKNIAFVPDSKVTSRGQSRMFTVTYDSLGEPSCAKIWYKVGTNVSNAITIGTSQTYCSTSFPNLPWGGVYTASGGVLTFNLTMLYDGLAEVSFLIKNDVDSYTRLTTVTVSSLACQRPTLDIENRTLDFFNPTIIKRSKFFTLIGITRLNCDEQLDNTKQWFLYEIDSSSGKTLRTIDLKSNPTSTNAEIFIQENYLDYGLYKFVYEVTMYGSGSGAFKATVETFIKIVPTGIAIFAWPAGVREIIRGTAQMIELDPGSYSYDFDGIYKGTDLKYRYFCRIVVDGLPRDFPSTSYNNYVDLKQLKLNSSLVTMGSDTTCFNNTDMYFFTNGDTKLTIKSNSLDFVEGRDYQILVVGSSPAGTYDQLVKITIVNYNNIPVVNLGCKFQYMCTPYRDYQKINPNTQLMIISECTSGCTNVDSIYYQFSVSKEWNIVKNDPQAKWISCTSQSLNNTALASTPNLCVLNSTNVIGLLNKTELTILKDLFLSEPDIKRWRIDFTVTTTSYLGGTAAGKASIIVALNEVPTGGSCQISPLSGVTGSTVFTIDCINWQDPDGYIARYEYFLSIKDNPTDTLLNFENKGTLKVTMPQGPEYDSYNIQVYVRVVDDTGGVTKFILPNTIQVKPNETLASNMVTEILNADPKSSANTKLFSGDLRSTAQVMSSLVAMLNSQSYSDKQSVAAASSESSSFLTTYGPDRNVSYNANFNDLQNIQPQYSGFSATTNMTNSSFEDDRNERAAVREKLAQFVSNLTVSHASSMKLVTSVLTSLTQRPDEISRDTASTVTDKCLEITAAMSKYSEKMPIEDIKQAAAGVLGAIGSTILGVSNSLNGRQGYLEQDVAASSEIKGDYDTDLENFWTNLNNFALDGNFDSKVIAENKNMLYQKYQTVDTVGKGEYMKGSLIKAISKHSNLDQSAEIRTSGVVMTVTKTDPKNINKTVFEGLGKANVPSFCDLNPNNDTSACTKYENVTLATMAMPMAPCGHNGNNETKIGLSSTVSVSLLDSQGNEIPITNAKQKIDVWIPRDPNGAKPAAQLVNVTINNRQGNQLFPLGFNITASNASVHLEFAPLNLSVGYIVLLKFGMPPRLNSSFQDYDHWRLFCPSDLKQSLNTKNMSYLFFLNTKETGNFKGLCGIGIRELKPSEMGTYCFNGSKITPATPPLGPTSNSTNDTSTSLTSNFYYLSYTSGCYYLDVSTGKWSSDGVEVMSDTSALYTHCASSHLTTFAGGWVVVPSAINFDYVFANASIEKNPTIYATVIGLFALYLLFAIWGRYMDRQDVKKVGVAPLPDNQPGDNYFYEIIVFTGSRKDAGTDSKVRFILSGEFEETEIRVLEDEKRKPFRRGGVDSFIMATKHALGNLNYMRIWHDNSGKGKWASWYLKWLAVEKDDGLLDRVLPVAGEAQKTEFGYLLSKESKKNMSDGHLWFSIFARPAQSAFTRLERVTCCFVLLFISMLMNIMYYELDKSTSNGGIEIGPFYLTPEQIGIGVIVNLIVFPPSMLIVELFRRSRRRIRRSTQIRDALQKNIVQTTDINPELLKNKPKTGLSPQELNEIRNQFQSPMPTSRVPDEQPIDETKKTEKKKKKSKPLTFPWWFKIIAYILSFIFIGVSAFFVIVKGVEFGDQKVSKWLTSLVISFFTSVFLTQPLKVVLVAFFFVMIMRKSNDDEIDDDDDEDTKEKGLKEDEEWLHHYPSNIFAAKPRSKAFAPLNEGEVEEARENRLKEIKMWDILREILAYTMFLWILYIVSYANMNSYSYDYQKNLKKLFVPESSGFSEIMRVEDFWKWANDVLAPGLRASRWYNGDNPIGLAGYINDKTSRMIGYAMLRQIRVQKDSCTINSQLKNQINFCTADYSFFNEDEGKYGYGWNTFNASFKPESSMERIYSAYQYRTATDLNGYPLIGMYNTYWGGGFVYEMRGKMSYLQGNLSLLQTTGWIDRQTRAVIVEFSVYNPNINMFAVSELLVEFLPSGTILTSARFDPISLLNHYQGFALFTLVCDGIYVLFIIYFMVTEIRAICKIGRSYFKQFWSLVEWAIICFSWAAVAMYAYRIYAGNKVLEFFKQTSGYGYYKLQYVAFWNETLRYCLAFCAALGTLKFLKLLRFNKRMSFLASTIRHSAKELIAFAFMFIIIWCAFVQLMYLFFQDKTIGFSTFIRAMTTCFEIMLGKFQVDPLMKAHGFFGPLLFSLYNIFVVFILLNMFISIINDTFSAVRSDVEKQADDYHMINFITTKFKLWIGIENTSSPNMLQYNPVLDANKNAYKDQITYFPEKIDELLYILSELYVEQRSINNIYSTEVKGTARGTPGPTTEQSNILRIDVQENNVTKPESAIDRRKSAHRNRSALDPPQSSYRLPSATGRAPPNRLPPINKNLNDSNF